MPIALLCLLLPAAGPQDKRLQPPPGIEIPASARAELRKGLDRLGDALGELRELVADRPRLVRLLPDVEIFHKAVRVALEEDQFFRKKEVGEARTLLKLGLERARQLRTGKHPWTTATGLVVRAYRSRIDDSVQPYGLVVPDTLKRAPRKPRRLDAWFHGRNNTLTELRFVSDRMRRAGTFTPEDTIVLHPYGRFCNANKFAGETDLFEAIDHLRKDYAVDDDRIVVRGFSMGGAACWHFAVHHAGRWAAANPGAGFAETAVYQNIFKDKVPPTEIEQTLWHLYDATDYAVNLFNCPVVAYSGEIDKQKQAADIMAEAMKKEGLDLVHVIGPKTAHKYHPEARKEVARRIDALAARGRDPYPARIRFTTWTLRYPRLKWVHVAGLEEHWNRARVDAELGDGVLRASTQNVAEITFALPPDRTPAKVELDGRVLPASPGKLSYRKTLGRWAPADGMADAGLRKRPGLQGPIDDAFYDRFIMVEPTGEPLNEAVGAWVDRERTAAAAHWRTFFRGVPRAVKDRDLAADDVRDSHLLLWGDPSSNEVLGRILRLLPVRWTAEEVAFGDASRPAGTHVPVLIFPNPLNPERYVVVNSGPTFREHSHRSNSRHIPLLPDWALLDITAAPGTPMSRRVAAAGFFGERWELK